MGNTMCAGWVAIEGRYTNAPATHGETQHTRIIGAFEVFWRKQSEAMRCASRRALGSALQHHMHPAAWTKRQAQCYLHRLRWVQCQREAAHNMRNAGLHLNHGKPIANAHAVTAAKGQVRVGGWYLHHASS